MAKFFLFSALFLLFFGFNTPLWAKNGGPLTPISELSPCYAPAPDSFRITEMSSNSIRVDWQAVASGLSYSLEILRKNSAGGWDLLHAISYITDNFYYFEGNDPGGTSYRFKLRTNCSVGNPSEYFVGLDGITTILELVLGGRTPINPLPIFCTNIPLNIYNWVGFKVSKHVPGEGIVSSLFEYDENGYDVSSPFSFPSKMFLRRVDTDNLIVASTGIGLFPSSNLPSIDSENPTFIRDFGNLADLQIGRVELVRKNYQGPRINMCKFNFSPDPFWIWDEANYIFQPMVAFSVYDEFNNPKRVLNNHHKRESRFKVLNPFSDELILFNTNPLGASSEIHVLITNITMQVVFQQNIEMFSNQTSLSLENLNPGVYLLSIGYQGDVENIKIVKSQ